MRYRFSYAMHGALGRRLTCSVKEALNDYGSSNISTNCQLLPVIPALFSINPAHLHLLPDKFNVIVYVCLLTVRSWVTYICPSALMECLRPSVHGGYYGDI